MEFTQIFESMNSLTAKEAEKICVLCCQEVEVFAVGKCDHPVCYRCSTKMRVLCDQKYCAVCREELDKVVFVEKLQPFSRLPPQQFRCEKKYDIYFSDENIYAKYRYLLSPVCRYCPEPKVFSKFDELEHHMRKQHEVFSCKLCANHLKVFCHERKWYNRKELAQHRAHGDPDDTSHRGHPLCKFCDDRYLDNDELLKHLRRDHYFCHFCDADGSQEYYSDYQYLTEHFRERHYLCEEGHCATEQFTHAFRTEIDYKAHKAAFHSKNRAEARQNRHIDLQFNYAPRQQRRNEGMVSFGDYEEVRHGQGGRPHVRHKSWRYSRQEEDRAMAAAMRASMAMQRQEEKGAVQERAPPKHRREERMEPPEPEESHSSQRNRNPKIPNKPPVRTMRSPDPEQDEFPVLGASGATNIVKPTPTAATVAPAPSKEEEFPRLSKTPMTLAMASAYSTQTKKSSFQEEDFPALVPKAQPHKPAACSRSAWSKNTPLNRPSPHGPSSSKPAPPFSSDPLLLSSAAPSSNIKKGGKSKKAPLSPRSSDDEGKGLTQHEVRSVPTMLDISSLLTVKGENRKPLATSSPPNQTPSSDPPFTSVGKKKRRHKNNAAAPPGAGVPGVTQNAISGETAAQKENVPEKPWNKLLFKAGAEAMTNGLDSAHVEKSSPPPLEAVEESSQPTSEPELVEQQQREEEEEEEEEEFPALISKNPPPGFKSSFPTKAANLPTPPPGLAVKATKPPPGFTGIPLNSNIVEPAPTPVNLPPKVSYYDYSVPDNFQERNLALILSIRKVLSNDESNFNEFKNYSAQFRQGVMSAAQYHHSCKELLGDNFNSIFNELLVLLPDISKQQELLTAHRDFRATDKKSDTGRRNKNKKNKAHQGPSTGANAAAELDCQACPTCAQVLGPKDFNSHKSLHIRDNEEFPSLQSISRICS
ncbi:E3 ubiquitin-protein ligase ZNF598 isoform X1 [Takifugu rubripes]|uniref:RING-type E3 ubiquitin transferase n=2 Tax=Takifugu rubripes TaxID=31033 RepID=H2RX96_TAKRU|nr:E3 ubiquitin-protein ligase ZNF598 isoform X1 [Takifugu rubripes]